MEGSLIETSDHFNLVEGRSDIKEEAEDVLEELNLSVGDSKTREEETNQIYLSHQIVETDRIKRVSNGDCQYRNTYNTLQQQMNKLKRNSLRYECDECEYVTVAKRNLKHHKKVEHEGVRYPCGECEYVATTNGHL